MNQMYNIIYYLSSLFYKKSYYFYKTMAEYFYYLKFKSSRKETEVEQSEKTRRLRLKY